MNLLPIDELNVLNGYLLSRYPSQKLEEEDEEDIIDEMLDLFMLAYARGVESAKDELGVDKPPTSDDAIAAVNAEVAGKIWRERVGEYAVNGGTIYDIERIAETDMTRIYNTAKLDTVRVNGVEGSTFKRWITMEDDRVRDTHAYLDGMVVPYDADFWTYDGDHARAPGLFSKPENVINCRCVCELVRG